MKSSYLSLLYPPKYPDYETNLKARIVHTSLIVCAPGSLALILANYSQSSPFLIGSIFLVFLYSIFGLIFFKRIPLHIIGLGLCSLVWVVLTYNLFDGTGLYDQGLTAFPLFIIFSGFLFDWEGAILTATLMSVVSITLVYASYLFQLHWVKDSFSPKAHQILTLVTIFVAFGCVTHVIKQTWKNMLTNIGTSYDLTLQAMAFLLEQRDQETEGHSQRVVELSLRLANEFEFNKDGLRYIRWGAYLHDLGKITIPDAILLKPGELDEKEWKIMKRHPETARNVLEKIPSLRPALNIPYYHHERWDGNGYPEGLAGEKIPLEARLFAVVDVFDALTNTRPYHAAGTPEEALKYIYSNSGTQFDPEVVSRFVKVMRMNAVRVS